MCSRHQWLNILTFVCITCVLDIGYSLYNHAIAIDEMGVGVYDKKSDAKTLRNYKAHESTICVVDCGTQDIKKGIQPDPPTKPKATTGEDFPWNNVRSFIKW